MANMQPAEIPAGREVTRSEREFFEILQHGLSDEFWVYHSLPFVEPKRGLQGESDFVVLHPQLGMLVIECKGYGVKRNTAGQWVRTFHGREQRLTKTPAEQAVEQVNHIVEKLQTPLRRALPDCHGRFPLAYGWAVAFPFTRWDEEELPPDFEPELIIDADCLADIERHVIEAYKFHRRRFTESAAPTLSDDDFRRFRLQVFSPEVDLAPNLAGAIEVERNRLLRLTEEQAKIVRLFMVNRRLRVHGAAGTGKTVLAQHGALMLAREGKDVLLICYNRNLKDHLRQSIEDLPTDPGSVYVTSFHTLCNYAHWLLHDAPMQVPDDEAAAAEFWIEEAPPFVLEALEKKKFAGWDAIVVDEGQDFAESWWTVLEAGLREEDSQICVFYDDAQTIFDHGATVPDYPAVFPLLENFRNTKRISEAITELGVAEMTSHERCPDGDVPSVYQQPGPSKTVRMVGELLTDLLEKQRLRPEQIVILSPRTPANSVLGEVAEIAGVPIVHSLDDRARGVLHTSIGAFKGLEADAVIMVDIDPGDERCDANTRYVAASRACHRLYVFQKGNWQESSC